MKTRIKIIWNWIKTKETLILLILSLCCLTYIANRNYIKNRQINKLIPLVEDYRKLTLELNQYKIYYNLSKEKGVFNLREVPFGKVIYMHGVPEFRDEGLIGLDSLRRYSYYDVGIFSPIYLCVFKIRIPAYAQGMFSVGNMVGIKPQTKEKEEEKSSSPSKSKKDYPLNYVFLSE